MAKREEIPVIDLKSIEIRETTKQFGDALAEFGFAVVVNHGVPEAMLKDAYRVAERAFALPTDVKRRYEHESDGRFTGYCSYKVEHAAGRKIGDLKEFWHFRRHVPADRMRTPDELPEFEPMAQGLYSALERVSDGLLGRLDDYLGQAHGTFVGMTRNGNSLIRFLHYPPLKGNERAMRAAPHEDINFITLLVSATASGLEVKTRAGKWIPVTNPPNAIIVNSGDMLQLYTGGRVPSTTHRVVNGKGRKSRYSIPFFVHPRSEVVLSKSPRKTAGEYLDERFREIGLKK